MSLKSALQSCLFTCRDLGSKILSVKVTVPVAVKSQDASAKPEAETKLDTTDLNLTFGKIVINSFDKVTPDNNAAEIHFPLLHKWSMILIAPIQSYH